MDRRYLLAGGRGLGDFDPVAGLFSLGSSLIQAGGTVGSAVITADAAKYVVKQNDATSVSIAQINAQAQQNLTATQTAGTTAQLQTVADTLTSWPVLLFGLGLVAILASGGRRDERREERAE
jgi:DNA-binding MurR/RpiR family transcriptional regulator